MSIDEIEDFLPKDLEDANAEELGISLMPDMVDNSTEESSKPAKKQKSIAKKRKRSSTGAKSSTKMKRNKASLPADNYDEKVVELAMQYKADAIRESYQAEKEYIFSTISEGYKRRFNEVVFAPWMKSILPALIVSPYDVPPGSVRYEWIRVYEQVKKQDRLEHLPYLIYWYGADSENSYYGFAPSKGIISYKDGMQKYRKLPKSVQTKIDKGESLTPVQQKELVKWEEVDEDLALPPEQRRRGVIDFPEVDELVEREEITDEELRYAHAEIFAVKKSPHDVEKNANLGATSKKMKKKTKAKKEEKFAPKPEKKQKVKESNPGGIDIEDFAEPDESSDDDKDDEDFKSTQEVEDEDYIVDEATSKKTKKKKSPKISLPKASSKKKAPANEESRAKAPPKKVKKEVDPLKQERSFFLRCKKEFMAKIYDLADALADGTDANIVVQLLQEIKEVADEFSAPFIEKSNISTILKKTKELFPESKLVVTALGALRLKLKGIYNTKKPLVPPGFEPPALKAPKIPKSNVKPPPDAPLPRANSPVRALKKEVIESDIKKKNVDPAPKSAPKKKPAFSFGGLVAVAQQKGKPQKETATVVSAEPNVTTQQVAPSWIKESVTLQTPKEEYRWLGLQLLIGMAHHFPPGTVDVDSMAANLERALFAWSQAKAGAVDLSPDDIKQYWRKLNMVVASVCGKRERGSLIQLILTGSFATPEKLINLSDQHLHDFFEGKSVVI